jgi:hypothetical protein
VIRLDPTVTMNFILCLAILLLALYIYSKKKMTMPLLIGIGFGLFAISHLATLLGLAETWETSLIAVRTITYLVIYVLIRLALSRGVQPV